MIVYLEPLSLFPELHSDTIFGAIVYAINELYSSEVVDEMIKEFKEEPPFLISSAFPYGYNNEIKVRFFPKPIFKTRFDIEFSPNDFKTYKKIEYFEEELFFKLVNSEITESDIIASLSDYLKVKNLLMVRDYHLNMGFEENILPNNSVNRLTGETELFYTSGNEFKNLGLFFIVEFNDPKYVPIIKSAIKFLKDRGFGKDISVGKGHFNYEIDDDYSLAEHLKHSDEASSFITLSRFIPNTEKNSNELNEIIENSTYEIGSKRGISSNGEIRKQVRFFKEGSIFNDYKKVYGTLIKSGTDNNPAVEYGFAFPLKCIGNEGLNNSGE